MRTIRVHLIAVAVWLAAACLAGCGGGGDGSGGGPVAPEKGFSLSVTSIDVTGDTSETSPPFSSVDVTVTNTTLAGVYFGAILSRNGIYEFSTQSLTNTSFRIDIRFRDPSAVGPGNFTDTMQLFMCGDSSCNARIGDPQSFTTHYSVTGVALPRPGFTLGSTTVNSQTLSFVQPVTVIVPMTVTNITTGRVQFTDTEFSTNAVGGVDVGGNGGPDGYVSIWFKAGLPIGTYTDSVTVVGCNLDSYACQQVLDGSGVVIHVTLSVSDTITGANGYTVKFAQVAANHLAWDSTRHVLFASTPNNGSATENTIATIDPDTGAVLATTPVGSAPNLLAVSKGDEFLYVGRDLSGDVERLSLPAMTVDLTMPLAPARPNDAHRARDIQPSPDNSHTVAVAVALGAGISPECDSLAIYDDDQARPELVPGGPNDDPCTTSVQWGADSSVLYANDAGAFPSGLYTLAVGPGGLVQTFKAPGTDFEYGGDIHFAAGTVIADGGANYDTEAQALLGVLPFTSDEQPHRTILDVPHNRFFIVWRYYGGTGGMRIQSYDFTTHAPIALIDLPYFSNDQLPGSSPPLVYGWAPMRWGSSGLAFPINDGRVVIISGDFVGP